MLGIKIEKENKALKWGKVNLQRSCSWHRLTSVVCDQTKKEKKLKTKILTKKEMLESSAWAKNYKFNHSIFFSPKEQVIPWW